MAEQLQAPPTGDGPISEWHPNRRTLAAWYILSIPIFVVALAVYGMIAVRGEIPMQWTIDSTQIIVVLALTFGLAWVHEGVHGLAILAFGATPSFGVLKIGVTLAGFYTTAPGHRFGRTQYLIICLAPLVLLAPLGVPACMLPFGAYLMVPFAILFTGCMGDVTIAWHVLRGPHDVLCEDLRDGLRLWRREA
jgi:hypothetical protein